MNINQHTIHEPKLLIEIEAVTKRIMEQGLKRKDLTELVRLLDGFEQIYSCNHVYTDYIGLFEFLANHQFHGFKQMHNGHCTHASLLEICDGLLEHYSWLFQVNKSKVLRDLRQYKHRVKSRLKVLKQLTEDLFNRYSRNLIVRVNSHRFCRHLLVR